MQHVTLSPFGQRPVAYCDLARLDIVSEPVDSADKWTVFDHLRRVRGTFGLTDRDLGVLSALLSFLPGRTLQTGAPLIVFPSNATLSDRAHGMAESTLRRHLAALVAAGLIWRHDSPNGKRFAVRRAGEQIGLAYGFDLTPLLRQADRIAILAAEADLAADQLHRRREALILRLRDATKLVEWLESTAVGLALTDAENTLAAVRRGLRRKMSVVALQSLEDMVLPLLKQLLLLSGEAEEMEASAAHFDCHHQSSETDILESEQRHDQDRATDASPESPPTVPLALVLKACPDLMAWTNAPPRDWQGLVAIAAAIRPHMGISESAWEEACTNLGRATAAVTLAAMLQRFTAIRSAGAYLRALARKAGQGGFSPGPMIMALLTARKVDSCQLSLG